MEHIINREMKQGSVEWHELRKTKITATDACAIMGVSKWKTARELYDEKTSTNEKIVSMNRYMQRGLDLEPIARKKVSEHLECELRPAVVISGDMMASLDCISDDNKTVVEIKCAGAVDHAIAMTLEVPEHYMPQLQHQMYVCDVDHMYYYSFDGETGITVYVSRDDEFIKKMLVMEDQFLQCLKNSTPPYDDFVDKSGVEGWNELAENYRLLKESIERDEKKLEQIKKKLVTLSEGKNCKGSGISICHEKRVGSVDYSKIPELEFVDLEKYRKKMSEYTKILLCK